MNSPGPFAPAAPSAPEAPAGDAGRCAICGRAAPVTRHHLAPRSQHGRLRKRPRRGGGERDLSATIPLCAACHSTVHRLFSEKELAASRDTLEKLLADESVARWREWLAGKPDGFSPRLLGWASAPHRVRGRRG